MSVCQNKSIKSTADSLWGIEQIKRNTIVINLKVKMQYIQNIESVVSSNMKD
tara:strand:- start:777 stop:932 length:156 start_codon:yes stop_codon:yes gene_type:complete